MRLYSYKYTGPAPVKPQQQVYLMVDGEVYETARVSDTLGSQFTVMKKGRTRYFFYADKGLTWKPLS